MELTRGLKLGLLQLRSSGSEAFEGTAAARWQWSWLPWHVDVLLRNDANGANDDQIGKYQVQLTSHCGYEGFGAQSPGYTIVGVPFTIVVLPV